VTGVRDTTALAKDLVETVARVLGSQPGCRVVLGHHGVQIHERVPAVNAGGAGQFVRFTLSPEKGEHSLPVEQRATADPHYLMKGVFDELPIRYRVMAQLAHDDDQTTDASKAWPADREWVDLGVVEMTGPDTERERDGDILVNDPMRVTDGIEPPDDPILQIRTHVYGESVLRCTGVARPDTL